jgi:ribosomal protein L16/L10AE
MIISNVIIKKRVLHRKTEGGMKGSTKRAAAGTLALNFDEQIESTSGNAYMKERKSIWTGVFPDKPITSETCRRVRMGKE